MDEPSSIVQLFLSFLLPPSLFILHYSQMPPIETAQLLKEACLAAQDAGTLLREQGQNLREISFQDATDVKLKADTESETLIRDRLAATGWPVIGEEQGGDKQLLEGQTPYWVVDPLDGTYNYLRQMPLCCVSIGLMQGLDPLLGVIYNFNDDNCYTGVPGGDFCINEKVVVPQWPDNDDEACIATGFPAGRNYSSESLQQFITQVQRFKKVRMLGSAALSLAYVASGRADVYVEEGVRLWDIAAGLALAKTVGAHIKMTPYPEKPFAYTVCVAGRERWLM